MLTLNQLIQGLGGHIISQSYCATKTSPSFSHIRLWEADELIQADTLYLYQEVDLPQNLDICTTLVCTKDLVKTDSYFTCQNNGNIIFTDMSLSKLYNTLITLFESELGLREEYSYPSNTSLFANTDFSKTVCNLLDGLPCSDEECKMARQSIPTVLYGEKYRLIVLQDVSSSSNILYEAQALLQPCLAINYRGTALFFRGTSEQEAIGISPILVEKLQIFAEKYNLYWGYGSVSKYITAVQTMYPQCTAAIRLGKKLSPSGTRVFDYFSFCIYHYIEMCTNEKFSEFHRNRKYYYCHPAYLRLMRYDFANNTSLLKLLDAYLESNCNIAKTAQQTYMHRNTVINKLKKIREIIGVSLEDRMLRENLLFSFRVREYVEKYCEEDLFPGAVMN